MAFDHYSSHFLPVSLIPRLAFKTKALRVRAPSPRQGRKLLQKLYWCLRNTSIRFTSSALFSHWEVVLFTLNWWISIETCVSLTHTINWPLAVISTSDWGQAAIRTKLRELKQARFKWVNLQRSLSLKAVNWIQNGCPLLWVRKLPSLQLVCTERSTSGLRTREPSYYGKKR